MVEEAKQLERLKLGAIDFRPLRIELVTTHPKPSGADAIVATTYGKKRYVFSVECKSRSTPRIIAEAVAQAKACARPPDSYPMILVPYLPKDQILLLEAAGVSGLDACGNGVVVVPNHLLVIRTGNPNQYPDSAPLRNPYRGDASLVARALLTFHKFNKIKDIRDEIRRRGGDIALSTVSKAIRRIEDDLIITRREDGLVLLQPDKLLESLTNNYIPPKLGRPPVQAKSRRQRAALLSRLVATAREHRLRIAATGASSIARYAVMAREDKMQVYASNATKLIDELHASGDAEFSRRFVDLEILETDSPLPFFDVALDAAGFPWASALQTYLELMCGDKRDRETAEEVLRCLLRSRAQVERQAGDS